MAHFEPGSAALCRLQLAYVLRGLRDDAGLAGTRVVQKMFWSQSKLHRLETADNSAVEAADVASLCEMYGAGAELTETLMGYAEVTKTKEDELPTSETRPRIRPSFSAYLGLEAAASALHTYQNEYIPGLLQTEAYVRVMHHHVHQGWPQEDIDREVAVRMSRQKALHREGAPLKFAAIINEGVLYRQVGGPGVMREQLEHICQSMSSLPNVRVQVIPFKAGVHPAMDGPFTVMQFKERQGLKPIIYLENLAGALVVRTPPDVEHYQEAFTDLQATALSPVDSLHMIKAALKEY
jgi:hypothetical protein